MKAILSKIGTVLLVIVAVPLFVVLIVGLLPVILWFVLLDAIRKLSELLRKDPKHTPPKRYHIYSNNEYPQGKDGLRKYFDRYVAVIKKDCAIDSSVNIAVEGFNEEGELSSTDNEGFVTLSATLRANHGTATVKMEATYFTSNMIFAAAQDDEVPPYLEVIYKQSNELRTVFDVSGYDSLEFLVASLNNGQRLSHAGQTWTKLKDDLWIVNYSVKKSDRSDRIRGDYGYRYAFSDTKARQYFFDRM